MENRIGFSIGKETNNLDKPPFRAYFHWINEGELVNYEDFSKEELESEIISGQRVGQELDLFKEALNRILTFHKSIEGEM